MEVPLWGLFRPLGPRWAWRGSLRAGRGAALRLPAVRADGDLCWVNLSLLTCRGDVARVR